MAQVPTKATLYTHVEGNSKIGILFHAETGLVQFQFMRKYRGEWQLSQVGNIRSASVLHLGKVLLEVDDAIQATEKEHAQAEIHGSVVFADQTALRVWWRKMDNLIVFEELTPEFKPVSIRFEKNVINCGGLFHSPHLRRVVGIITALVKAHEAELQLKRLPNL